MHRFRLRRDSDGRGVRARPIGDSMRNLKLQRPSPALIVSVLALSVALGGTGYAAVVYRPTASARSRSRGTP
jgi:hypothetical protein